MTINSLSNLNEIELEKILKIIDKVSDPIETVTLSRVSKYNYTANEHVIKTDKVYQDTFLKLTVNAQHNL